MKDRTTSSSAVRGFTLVELLTVIAVISVLLVLVAPSVVSMARGQGITRAINEVSAACEGARVQAMSRNTWVFVCLSNPASGYNNQLTVAVLTSKDGTNSVATGGAQLNAANLLAAGPLVRVQNASAKLDDPTDASHQTAVASVLTCTMTMGGSGSVTYDTVVAFSPQGEATLDPNSRSLSSWVQLHVAEFRGTVSAVNTAEVKLSGVSGQCVVLRQ